MKRIISILAIAFIMLFASAKAQSLNHFFNKYDNDSRFESVSVGKFLLNLALFSGDLQPSDRDMISKIKKIKILTTKNGYEPEFAESVMLDLNNTINKGNFENLVEVRDKGDHVNIYTRFSGDNFTDLLIAVKEPDEISLIWISGKISRDFIEKIQKNQNGDNIAGSPLNLNL